MMHIVEHEALEESFVEDLGNEVLNSVLKEIKGARN